MRVEDLGFGVEGWGVGFRVQAPDRERSTSVQMLSIQLDIDVDCSRISTFRECLVAWGGSMRRLLALSHAGDRQRPLALSGDRRRPLALSHSCTETGDCMCRLVSAYRDHRKKPGGHESGEPT